MYPCEWTSLFNLQSTSLFKTNLITSAQHCATYQSGLPAAENHFSGRSLEGVLTLSDGWIPGGSVLVVSLRCAHRTAGLWSSALKPLVSRPPLQANIKIRFVPETFSSSPAEQVDKSSRRKGGNVFTSEKFCSYKLLFLFLLFTWCYWVDFCKNCI